NSCADDHNLNSFDCPADSYHPPHPTYETYSGDSCGNNSQSGYDCLPQFPLNYEPEPGYTQNYKSCPHDSPSIPQQYPCYDDCGVTHEPYQCQPTNHDYYDEQNSCYDSNSFGFDQIQTPQYTVNHQIFNAHNDLLNSQNKLMEQMTSMCEMVGQLIQKKQEEKQIQEDQAANARYWKIPAYYDDDNDYNFAITPNEPVDSLSMTDEHLDTILAMESDEFIKSSVENLVPNPSESEGETGCDLPAYFTTFSNILFDAEYEFDSVDNQSLHNEDFSEEIFSNPLFEEEINSMRIGQHYFNAESDLIESVLNHDFSIIPSSSKIDSLLDEFTECSSCGSLYTRDCSCSKGSVKDKILVPKPPKNCARYGHPFNGPYCQGCTLLREKLEEDLVAYFQRFQNTFESSDGSTNVVNAHRELSLALSTLWRTLPIVVRVATVSPCFEEVIFPLILVLVTVVVVVVRVIVVGV
nr:hypothetical protein [Tanacetum cinerariifolium]